MKYYLPNEAHIQYMDGEFQIIRPGSFVFCSVTRKHLALEQLSYWSVERQEAYSSAEASFARELELNPSWKGPRKSENI